MPEDARAIFERYCFADPEVTRYMGWPRHSSVEDTQGIRGVQQGRVGALAGGSAAGLFARDTGKLLGGSGLVIEAAECAANRLRVCAGRLGKGLCDRVAGGDGETGDLS